MKYTLIIPQAGVVRAGLIGKVTLADLSVLDYLKGWFFYQRSKRVTVDQQEFIWLHYGHAVTELPLVFNPEAGLRTRRNQLSLIVQRLHAAGLVDSRKVGRGLYLRPTSLAAQLHFGGDPATDTSATPTVTKFRDDTVTQIRDDSKGLYIDGNIDQGTRDNNQPLYPHGGLGVNVCKVSSTPRSDPAEEIYAAYPKKVAKPAALRAIQRALKKHPAAFLLERTRRYADLYRGDPRFIPNPANWFSDERFLDDESTWTRTCTPTASRPHAAAPPRTFADLDYSSPP